MIRVLLLKVISWMMITSSLVFNFAYAQTSKDTQQFYQLETYNPQRAQVEQRELFELLKENSYVRIDKRIVETKDLNKIYAFRGYKPMWVTRGANGKLQLNAYFYQFKELVVGAWAHGLVASDYWHDDIYAYTEDLEKMNDEYWIAAELLLTQSYLRLADDLTNGRFNPEILDNDVRFVKKPFDDHGYLNEILYHPATQFKENFWRLSPQHPVYQDLYALLIRLQFAKSNNLLPNISSPAQPVLLGETHAVVPVVRKRLDFLGYKLTNLESPVVDEELIQKLNEYQREHEVAVTSAIPISKGSSAFWNLFSLSVDAMILQTEINMEKMRWLPRVKENRYIWVNTNAAELVVYENDQVVMNFKTVNGQILRRTPMMRDLLTGIILNPTWTATDSIAIQDKLPEIQKDISYLNKARMRVVTKQGDKEVDPLTLDWKGRGREIIRSHYLVMEPGPTNALGVMRFNLSLNRDAIYMHDTNDHSLFASTNRHFSSGCIRLEKPFELAAYVLRNDPVYNLETLHLQTAKGTEGEVYERNKLVQLKKEDHIPVYLMPMTVEKNIKGRIRFMSDVYAQDRRLGAALLGEGVRDENF